MAEHVFEFPRIEEFYNSCHTKANGTFCGSGTKSKHATRVPMSENARRSNAVLRRISAARRSPEYKLAQKRAAGSWADREKGQGGLRHVKGANSKKADAARATNAVKGGKTKRMTNLNTKAASESAIRAKAQLLMLKKMNAKKN